MDHQCWRKGIFLHVLTAWVPTDAKFYAAFVCNKITTTMLLLMKILNRNSCQTREIELVNLWRLLYCISKLNSDAHYSERLIWKATLQTALGVSVLHASLVLSIMISIYIIYIYSSLSCKLNLGSETKDGGAAWSHASPAIKAQPVRWWPRQQ